MKMIRKCISGCLALLILFSVMPVQAFAAEEQSAQAQAMALPGDLDLKEPPQLPQPAVEGEPLDIRLSFSSQDDKSAEELYEGYASRAFFGTSSSDSAGLNAVGAGRELSDSERVIYNALKMLIEEVASPTYQDR